jgi:putative ABC transport system permease protein
VTAGVARLLLRLRWSWRDLRARWLQVAAIALVIGIGSGVYSGLSSTSEWRTASYDASYEQLVMWDLHVELAEGSTVPTAALLDAVTGLEAVEAAEARLVLPTQVDASSADQTVLLPGLLVGVDVSGGGPDIARLHTTEGRGFEPGDAGRDVVVLDEHVAAHYDLEPGGEVRVADGTPLEHLGRALSPEHFIIIPPQGTIFGESGYAVVWAPLETAQRLTGNDGRANDLVITAVPGASVEEAEAEVAAALAGALPEVGTTITRQADDRGLRTLYDDIEGDQRFNNVFALLILAGAAFAAFNLTGRIIESQRREIGIGMALGVPTAQLAARPLLVAVQVALLGVAFGVAVGFAIQAALASVLASVFPLPTWQTDFQPGVFARGAALGLVLPVLATIGPIVRAVRVAPVEAISTTHRASSGGLAPLLRGVRVPGGSLAQLPVRNVLRAPRRSLLTALGIGAAIATLVGVLGMVDSYLGTLERGRTEILGDTPDRLTVDLEPGPVAAAAAQDVLGSPVLGDAEANLVLGGTVDPGGEAIPIFLSVVDLSSDLWRPTVVDGSLTSDGPGLVLAQKAVEDLGASVGDVVTLRHPLREGFGFRLVDSEVPVIAVHPNPFRFTAYLDIDHAELFALDGITNAVSAVPATGSSVADVQRALFGQPGVIAVQPLRAQAEAIEDRLEDFFAIFTILQVVVLVLALLIAFNSTSINVDERRRENATMFAFGVPVRTALRSNTVESLVTGVLGIAVGIALGRLLVSWLTQELMADTLPDIGIIPEVALSTVLTAVALGLIAVALAPLLTVRKLRRMDIPSTLRVVE